MGKYPGLIYFVLKRLDSLMAIGKSRHQAKQRIREELDEVNWNGSTGMIYSHTTRKVYQQQILAFANWAIATYQIRRPVELDTRADELACQYLQEGIEKEKSPYTLQTERSALRLYFGWKVAESVILPQRKRTDIKRSRVPVKQDEHFQPQHWPDQVMFAQATGLRFAEMRDVRVGEIIGQPDGRVLVYVRNGKGGKARNVPVLAGYEQDILAMVEGRMLQERVFDHVPKNMDVQSYRRASAQARYRQQAPGRMLPSVQGKRKAVDYDAQATLAVSRALGHNRRSIVTRHYLR
jgi:integrase